jgi:hypothetical protein
MEDPVRRSLVRSDTLGGFPPRPRRLHLGFLAAVALACALLSLNVGPGVLAGGRAISVNPSERASEQGLGSGVRDASSAAATDANVLPLIPEPSSVPSWCGIADDTDRYTSDSDGWLSLQSNLFNLSANAAGGSKMCYDNSTGTLSDSISMSTPGAHANSVLGFPAAVFGQNIHGGGRGDDDPALPLPDVPASNVTGEALWSAVNYSVVTKATQYNFAFDDWLTETEANATLGRDPGPRIEVMVWFATNLNRSWLHQESVSLPSFVNGTVDPRNWLRDQWCQDNNSQVTFDYYYENTPNNTSGTPAADIAVNMSAIFANVAQYIATNPNGTCFAKTGTDISSYYVDELPLGIEFYPNVKSENETVSWSVNSWCLTLASGTVTGNAVDCDPSNARTVAPLHVSASANVTSGLDPLDVGFAPTVAGGEAPYSYLWQFGAGLGTNSSETTNYTYWQPGTYRANVTVLDFNEIVVSAAIPITISAPLNLSVALRSSPTTVDAGATIEFVATVTGGRTPYNYTWWGLPTGPGCASRDASTLNCTAEASGSWTVVVGVADPGGYGQASTVVHVGSSNTTSGHPPPPAAGVATNDLSYLYLGAATIILVLAAIAIGAYRYRRKGGPRTSADGPTESDLRSPPPRGPD